MPDGLNQYDSVNGVTYAHDGNGNLTTDGSTTYTYDVENRLVSATGAKTAGLRYDPLGRLYQITDGSGGITRLLYDGDALVGESNTSGTMLSRYVHGLGGGDDPMIRYAGTNAARSAAEYLYADRLSSIVASFDWSGAVKAINTYDEFGVPGTPIGMANTGRFRYTGQIWIPELGQYHYKARSYSPTLGRFMQTDPLRYHDGLNSYAYVGNDAQNFLDTTGLFAECLGLYCNEMPGDPAYLESGAFSHGSPTHFEYLTTPMFSGMTATSVGLMHGSPLPRGAPCLVEPGYAFLSNEEANVAAGRAAEAVRAANGDRRNEYGWRVVPAGEFTWTFTPIELGGRGFYNTVGDPTDGGWGHLHNRRDGDQLSPDDQATTERYVVNGNLGENFSTALVGDSGRVYSWPGSSRLNGRGVNHGAASCP